MSQRQGGERAGGGARRVRFFMGRRLGPKAGDQGAWRRGPGRISLTRSRGIGSAHPDHGLSGLVPSNHWRHRFRRRTPASDAGGAALLGQPETTRSGPDSPSPGPLKTRLGPGTGAAPGPGTGR